MKTPRKVIRAVLDANIHFSADCFVPRNLRLFSQKENQDRCASSADIVTGDKHLLEIGEYDSVKIVTASQFLELLMKQGG